jgi:hypothetical protein
MKLSLTRITMGLSLLATLMMFPAMAHAQCTRCCGVQGFVTSLTITPTSAEDGQPVSITIGVSSCYYTAKVFTATVNIIPTAFACESFAEEFSVSGTVFPGQHRIFTYTLPAPKCDSTYDVIMNGAVRATLTVE